MWNRSNPRFSRWSMNSESWSSEWKSRVYLKSDTALLLAPSLKTGISGKVSTRERFVIWTSDAVLPIAYMDRIPITQLSRNCDCDLFHFMPNQNFFSRDPFDHIVWFSFLVLIVEKNSDRKRILTLLCSRVSMFRITKVVIEEDWNWILPRQANRITGMSRGIAAGRNSKEWDFNRLNKPDELLEYRFGIVGRFLGATKRTYDFFDCGQCCRFFHFS